ncbi:MAG: hypothetical protein ACFE7R_08200 [Candidatus Hodarchaeota archaeon]
MGMQRQFKTFVTEQRTLLFFQIMILFGMLIQVGMFFALLFYGRPPASDYRAISDFFMTCAAWVITINVSIGLFWWVSNLGAWPITDEQPPAPTEEDSEP